MKPLQLWLPGLGYSVGLSGVARDIQRAYREWQPSDDLVYLLPGLHQPDEWRQTIAGHSFGVRAVPAEHEDALAIVHVGANGRMYGPAASRQVHGAYAADILDAWLNLDLKNCAFALPSPIELNVPYVEGGVVKRRNKSVAWEVKAIIPNGHILKAVPTEDDAGRHVTFQWPPEPGWPRTVYPDAESAEAIVAMGACDRLRDTAVVVLWPPPFDRLFGRLAGFDVFHAHTAMRSLAQSSDLPAALAASRAEAAGYLCDGYSTRWHACFCPDAIQAQRGDARILPFWERYGIKAPTLGEAGRSPLLNDLVPVTRAWGGLGLLWALLIDRLESAQAIRSCPRCGTALGGRRKQCGRRDNIKCYLNRRSATKRRSRQRSAAKESNARGDTPLASRGS